VLLNKYYKYYKYYTLPPAVGEIAAESLVLKAFAKCGVTSIMLFNSVSSSQDINDDVVSRYCKFDKDFVTDYVIHGIIYNRPYTVMLVTVFVDCCCIFLETSPGTTVSYGTVPPGECHVTHRSRLSALGRHLNVYFIP